MGAVRKAGRILIDLMLGMAVALVAAALLAPLFGYSLYVIKSGSMEPVLKTGSVALVDGNARYEDVEVGDIAAFQTAGGMLAAHRVIRVTAEGLETKGDANESSDGIAVTEENFRGVVLEGCLPEAGYAIQRLNLDTAEKRWAVVLLILPLFLWRKLFKNLR